MTTVWVEVQTYKGLVEKVVAYETRGLAEQRALESLAGHLDETDIMVNPLEVARKRWIGDYGDCPCGEFAVSIHECSVEGKG